MADTSTEILIAEDDPAVRASLDRGLRLEGYRVRQVSNGLEALDQAAAALPDLVILDVAMPELDGLSACRRLRGLYPTLPILMLTARQEIPDRISGLDAGADDYLVKPYALGELAARVRALLRRTSVTGTASVLAARGLRLDPARRQAWRDSQPLMLTRTEFDLLEVLLKNSGIVMTREMLYDRIWGFDFGTNSRSLDMHISYLRQKTEAGGLSRVVETVRGIGYVVRC